MVKRKWSMVSIIAIFAILFQLFALDSSNKINAANGDEITIALPNFSNVNVGSQGLIDTTGHAHKSSDKIRLTNATFQQKGGLMKSSQISLDDGFSTYFSYKIDVPDFQKYYGDGLAFIIYSADEHQQGDFTAGGLGYAGIGNSIAVEFDTYPETGGNYGGIQDPNNHDNKGGSNVPHVPIMLDGNPNHDGQDDGKTPMDKIGNGFMEFENINNNYHVWVDFNPNDNRLTVTFGRGNDKGNTLNSQISRVIPQGTLDTNHVFVGM